MEEWGRIELKKFKITSYLFYQEMGVIWMKYLKIIVMKLFIIKLFNYHPVPLEF